MRTCLRKLWHSYQYDVKWCLPWAKKDIATGSLRVCWNDEGTHMSNNCRPPSDVLLFFFIRTAICVILQF